MLAYVLAIIIAIGSFTFYMAAFFVPEIHRRQDFVWSGVGMFYAVVLWFCAGRITGAVLLGQIASVALLGWLGWQTLELRRRLTPASVRTAATWQDVQQWGQAAQQVASKYLKMGSLVASVATVWTDARTAIAELRNLIAGPKGEVRSRSTVPALRRSPAYEFETETGQGESVPSEFATVPTQTQTTSASTDDALVPETSPVTAAPGMATPVMNTSVTEDLAATASSPSSETAVVAPSSEPAVDAPNSAAPAPSAIAQTDEAAIAAIATDALQAADDADVPSAQSAPVDEASTTSSGREAIAQDTPQTESASSGLASLSNWLGERLQRWRKPKPQRAVIEIPRRPPSIPRTSEGSDSLASSKTRPDQPSPSPISTRRKRSRAVIDIPPRPPSIPRPSKSEPMKSDQEADTSPPVAQPKTTGVESLRSQPETPNIPESVPSPVQSNQPQDDLRQTETTAVAGAIETNWPDANELDDSETNWPDD